jgi:hypothetical protein
VTSLGSALPLLGGVAVAAAGARWAVFAAALVLSQVRRPGSGPPAPRAPWRWRLAAGAGRASPVP